MPDEGFHVLVGPCVVHVALLSLFITEETTKQKVQKLYGELASVDPPGGGDGKGVSNIVIGPRCILYLRTPSTPGKKYIDSGQIDQSIYIYIYILKI